MFHADQQRADYSYICILTHLTNVKRTLIIASFFFISIASLPQKHLKLPDTSSTDTIITSVNRSELVSFAENYLGTPYRQSGMNPKKGFDCSGFVNFVFNHFHIKLPRSSKDFKTLGAPLEPADFKIGDVLVFMDSGINPNRACWHYLRSQWDEIEIYPCQLRQGKKCYDQRPGIRRT